MFAVRDDNWIALCEVPPVWPGLEYIMCNPTTVIELGAFCSAFLQLVTIPEPNQPPLRHCEPVNLAPQAPHI